MTQKDLPKTCLQCKQPLQSEPVRWGTRWFCDCGGYEVVEMSESTGYVQKFIPAEVTK